MAFMPTLETARLLLRMWQPSDRESFARMNRDPRVMQFFPGILTVDDSNRLVDCIEAHFELHGFGLWACELRDSGTFVGFVGLSVPTFTAPFTPAVEIGWRIASEYWSRGLATEAAQKV